MCGIIGILGRQPAAPLLVDGLKRLAYRGYDSAGVATLVNGHIERRRAEGKLANLEALLAGSPLPGVVGIGHTRWATHGRPNETNAHPHATDRVAIVHNGIIENFQELRDELIALGAEFETETDTEVVAHLLTHELECQRTPAQAMDKAMERLKGAFALAVIFAGRPDIMVGARRGAPLAVGFGEGEMYLGSDALALAPFTQRIAYLEEGDWTLLRADGASFFNRGQAVERPARATALSGAMVGKGNHRHFMMKEICEQPAVIGETLQSLVNPLTRQTALPALPVDLATLDRLVIIGCGTAFLAGSVAKYWFEQLARLPVELDIASEFRYRAAPLPKNGATLGISQSGETADTLAAMRYAKSQGHKLLAVINSPESTMAREADCVLPTLAGPEIGVASTKAFTTQLVVLGCLAIGAARARGAIDAAREAELIQAMAEVPALITEVLAGEAKIRAVARRDEAWAHRAHRRGHAGDRRGPDGRALRQDGFQSRGGGGPRRAGDPDRRQGRHRAPRAQGRPCHRGAGRRSLRRPHHLCRAGAAPRLSRRRRQRDRRRPAAQPGEERHGGVVSIPTQRLMR